VSKDIAVKKKSLEKKIPNILRSLTVQGTPDPTLLIMTTIRSSVRPASSKQPWGTILKPEFGMGYQKMTSYEIDQTVSRLYVVRTPRQQVYEQHHKTMPQEKIDEMVGE
jgi:hypothetical protein